MIIILRMEDVKESDKKRQEGSSGLHVDQSGLVVDKEGNPIKMKAEPIATTMYNQKRELTSKPRQIIGLQKNLFGFKMEGSYYDPAIQQAKRRREKRKLCAFSFIEEGTYAKRGEMIRKKQALEALDSADPVFIPPAASSIGQSDTAIARILAKGSRLRPTETVPDIEWWDAVLLPPEKKSFFPEGIENIEAGITEESLNTKRISNLVQHPPPVKNEYMEKVNNMQIEPKLTEKEKKKRSRIRRLEKEKDKREKIKLGLIPPPAPKIRMNNYMQILTKEAVADPSVTEAKVRKMIEERQMKHLKHNLERKLTKQQKYEKLKRKLNRDTNSECTTAVFRIETLVDPSQR